MKIIFTRHAEQRMIERGVSKKEVEDTLFIPQKSGVKENRHFVMKTRKNGHLLIVYYLDKEGVTQIITVITTSKVFKYLK